MDKIVPIDYPFDMVTFDLRPLLNKHGVLNCREWTALSAAEDRIFTDGHMNSYTSIIPRNEGHLARLVWDHCEAHMDDELEGTTEGTDTYNARIARRAARALAVCAFGPEMLLK